MSISSLEESQPGGSLYEQVAARINRLIERGTLSPGERIPSVRSLSRQLEVSVTTVTEAYRLLEDRGTIEARPQSGYYVRARFPETPSAPARPAAGRPAQVSISELVMMVIRDASQPGLRQLGAAIPNLELLPTERLYRALTAMAREYGRAGHQYDFPPGCPALRAQVARRCLVAGCELTPEELVTTTGCQEALNLALRAVCRPGDTVAVESPTFYGLLEMMEATGVRALELPTHPQEGIHLGALREAIRNHPVRACAMNSSFSNPLGHTMPEEKKEELVRLLAAEGIPLIEDDVVGDLGHTGARPKVAKAFDRKGLVLLCSSFSKTLSPGHRVGWIAPGRFQAEVERQKFVGTAASALLPQLAVAEFLRNGGYDHHLRRMRRAYGRHVGAMIQAVGRSFPPGTRVSQPAGGFIIWVELPEGSAARALYERALQAGIAVAPGPLFSATGANANCIRLSAARWSPEVEAAVATLGQLAAE